tara:strand:- start:61 stop:909 length:849 start_codon:yes stop_codon:yes gene_type:complete
MIINIVIPVFNRLSDTKTILDNIRDQITNNKLVIYIVNDISTDGTSEWLKEQKDINVLNGNGFLYWAGAVNLALNHISKKCDNNEWILLLNNDVTIKPNYIENLLKIGIEFYPSAVGSIVKNNQTNKLVSIGPKIFKEGLVVDDLINLDFKKENQKVIKDVDALSGRGALFPIQSILDSGGLRPLFMPHYFADYDLSIRIKKKGYRLIISLKSIVYTSEDFEEVIKIRRKENLFFKFFSKKSSSLLYAKFLFWWEASNFLQRVSLPLRIILFIIKPDLRKTL